MDVYVFLQRKNRTEANMNGFYQRMFWTRTCDKRGNSKENRNCKESPGKNRKDTILDVIMKKKSLKNLALTGNIEG